MVPGGWRKRHQNKGPTLAHPDTMLGFDGTGKKIDTQNTWWNFGHELKKKIDKLRHTRLLCFHDLRLHYLKGFLCCANCYKI